MTVTTQATEITVVGRSMFSDEIIVTETFATVEDARFWARRMNDADMDGIGYDILDETDDEE